MKDDKKKNEEMKKLSLDDLEMVAGGGRRGKANGGFNEGYSDDSNSESKNKFMHIREL